MITEKDLFRQALEKWGLVSQVLMLVEETQELAHACLKLLRSQSKDSITALSNFAQEIADVEFMIAQMKFAYNNQATIDKFRKLKRMRLAGLLGLEGAIE